MSGERILAALSAGAVVLVGALLATHLAGLVLSRFLARFEAELDERQKGGLTGGGYWIGVAERALIYIFVLIGEPAGIGFLAAAKSIFRIGEVKDSEDRKLAEYILIGTLFSFTAATVIGLVIRQVLVRI